jgi:hypothetical protein
MTMSILYLRQQGMSSGSMARAKQRQHQPFSSTICFWDGFVGRRLTDGVIHGLIHRRQHPSSLLAYIPALSDFPRREVTQPQLHKLSGLVQFVYGAKRLFKRCRVVRCMQIEYINHIGIQFFQRRGKQFFQLLRLVDAGLGRVDFGSNGEPAVFPASVARPAFLCSLAVDARRVDFIIATRLEVVEVLFEFIQGGYTCAGRFIGTCI